MRRAANIARRLSVDRAKLRLAARAGFLSVAGVLLITLGGRLLGFVREVLISSLYGTSVIADSFFTVQLVPTFVSTFLLGPLMIVYVPHYVALREAGTEGATFERTVRTAMRVGALITAAMIVVGVSLVLLRVGPAVEGLSLLGTFTVILAISILPLIVGGLATVILHARGRHVAAMAVAALAPAGMFASLVLLTSVPVVELAEALPWSFVAGSLLSALAGAIGLRSVRRSSAADIRPTSSGPPRIGGFRRELLASVVENIGFSVNQALTVLLAAGMGAGAVATNAYAFRIAAFAFSAIVSPLNQVVQTWMTGHPSRREGRKLFIVIAAVAVVVLAISAGLILVGRAIVEVVYLRGSFSVADAARVTALLRPYGIYIGVTALNQLMARYFFVQAQGTRYAGVMLAAYTGANILKVLAAGPFGLEGVIWASVFGEGAALGYFILYALRRSR